MNLLEIILGGIITQFLGLNTRYYFFKIFDKNLKKEDLQNDQEDIGASFSQGFYNFFTGLTVFILLSFAVVYLLDIFHLL
ncbi:hypothetical protein D1632_16510 [Chryseobacterium nematophagum]|uniref:Uncharacterized protein n=1 Tax=Chryseobacterium nematophagum TaxID=2305228 RepID=A0A3M7L8N7_9FLAO|nr:hypothetical protein [Chryseobacterium nematophagum]RMZ57912.1 hypothetical protein D1632_16510 [Chryseobacterium nematophagum]